MFSSIAEGRAHGMPSWQPRLTADQIWKLVTYIKSLRTRNEPQAAANRVKDTVMSRSRVAVDASSALSLLVRPAARTRRAPVPAETQPGAAADLNRPPQAGAARAPLQRSAVGG